MRAPRLTLHPPDGELWVEAIAAVLCVSAATLACAGVAAAAGTGARKRRDAAAKKDGSGRGVRHPRWMQFAQDVLLPALCIGAIVAVPPLLQRSLRTLPRMASAVIAYVCAWRVYEAVAGMSPHASVRACFGAAPRTSSSGTSGGSGAGEDRNGGDSGGSSEAEGRAGEHGNVGLRMTTLLLLASPVEARFDTAGLPARARRGELGRLARSMLARFVFLSLLCSWLHPREYLALGASVESYVYSSAGSAGSAGSRSYYNPYSAAPVGSYKQLVNSYAQTWLIFLFLSMGFDVFSLLLLAGGHSPITLFRSPLLLSTSPQQFWGRRWNLLVHGLIRRTVFVPLKDSGVPASLASLAAFLSSGFFHEYAWLVAFPGYAPGTVLTFFILQLPFTLGQALLQRTRVGAAIGRAMPQVVATAVVSLILLPTAPYFLQPCLEGGLFHDLGRMSFRVALSA